jgi:TM2 domain-containing membrane protein YozV
MDQQLYMMLQGLQPEELMFIQTLMKDMNETERQQFLLLYKGKRKDQQTMLILTIIGFFGIAGLQRFVIGETGMGILFLITFGFCGIGTIIDLVNNNSLATAYNQQQAQECAQMLRMMSAPRS